MRPEVLFPNHLITLFGYNQASMNIKTEKYKKHRGDSVRAAILPWAVILTKARRDAVSTMAKPCIVA